MSTIHPPRRGNPDALWAITSYWNPMRYRRRLANYRLFRERLSLPLVAVELAYGPDFDLEQGDAEIRIQLRGRDILWQKERLLNLALQALPSNCRKFVWVDCDVIFESDDWAQRTSELLDRSMLVQPFSRVRRTPQDWRPGQSPGTEFRHSAPFLITSGVPVGTCMGNPFIQVGCTPGHVWAARRELLEHHRFYDACIIGSGDSALTRAAYGHFEDAIRIQHLNRDHYLAWARPFHDAVRAQVAFVDGNLFHLWHGKTEQRRYMERLAGLSRFNFDPARDIAIDGGGAWRWSSDKHQMHDYVRNYFASRMEDG